MGLVFRIQLWEDVKEAVMEGCRGRGRDRERVAEAKAIMKDGISIGCPHVQQVLFLFTLSSTRLFAFALFGDSRLRMLTESILLLQCLSQLNVSDDYKPHTYTFLPLPTF